MQYTFTTDNDFLADVIVGVSRIVENSVLLENQPGNLFTSSNASAISHLLTCIMHTITMGNHDPNDSLLDYELEAWLSVADKLKRASGVIETLKT